MLEAALAAFNLGWTLTPLIKETKRPALKGWTSLPRPTEQEIRDWIQMDYALGVRTGPASGIVILDIDPGSDWKPDRWPDAPCATTPRGGWHVYFACPELPPKNSVGKLAPHVDVRGAGGQAALPGVPGRSWLRAPIGQLPAWPFPVEAKPAKRAPPRPVQGSNAWANKALNTELEHLARCPEGTRNDSLNRAAFNLGQIVAGGGLDEHVVRDNLLSVGLQIGLPEREVATTLESGLTAGKQTPRTPPKREPPVHVEIEDEPAASTPELEPPPSPESTPEPVRAGLKVVDAPGEHHDGGRSRSVSNLRFTSQVLKALEPGDLYRRMGVVGIVRGTTFEPIGPHEMRLVMDKRVVIFEHPMLTARNTKEVQFVNSNVDHAGLVLAAAKTSKYVRELSILSPHPIITPDFRVLRDGWHADVGALIVFPHDLSAVEPLPIWDAVSDFPLSDASKAGLLSLALCPFFRPLLDGNVPIHIVTAPLERSGKTMLVGDVLGPIWGYDVEMTTWAEDEDEMRKQIIATMLEGLPVLCIDNVPAVFDSHNIASMVTARHVGGRVLGQTKLVHAPNLMCLIATGNNTEASGEIAKRAIVVRIEPDDEEPEKRTGFRYPNLLQAVRKNRLRYMRWLLDLVDAARGKCPPMGGFQPYTVTVGAIVTGQGLPLLEHAQRVAIRDSEDMASLFTSWMDLFGTGWVTVSEALRAASAIEWGGLALDPQKSERSRTVWLGRRLAACVGRYAAGGRLEQRFMHGRREYRLGSREG